MANDLSANPWKIDTPGATLLYAQPVKILNIVWGNFTTTGDTLLIQDSNSKDIVNIVITTGFSSQVTIGFIGWVRGFKVITMTHGEITVAIGAGK